MGTLDQVNGCKFPLVAASKLGWNGREAGLWGSSAREPKSLAAVVETAMMAVLEGIWRQVTVHIWMFLVPSGRARLLLQSVCIRCRMLLAVRITSDTARLQMRGNFPIVLPCFLPGCRGPVAFTNTLSDWCLFRSIGAARSRGPSPDSEASLV